jgi:hypothetical protein
MICASGHLSLTADDRAGHEENQAGGGHSPSVNDVKSLPVKETRIACGICTWYRLSDDAVVASAVGNHVSSQRHCALCDINH